MYQFSGKLKTFSLALIIIGVIGTAFSFYSGSKKTIEDAKHAIEASHNVGHGSSHEETAVHNDVADLENHTAKAAVYDVEEAHDATSDKEHAAHEEHVLHQLQNRPWSAFYVALFFSLGITY